MSVSKKLFPLLAIAVLGAALWATPSTGAVTNSCNGMTVNEIPVAGNPPSGTQVFASPGVQAYYDGSVVRIGGTPGNDVVVGSNIRDFITTDGGDDTVCARKGNDTVFTLDDNDWAAGGQGNDLMYGGSGTDTLNGISGNDTLYGGPGGDTIHGGGNNDTVIGDGGDDQLFGDNNNDVIQGDNDAAAPGTPPGAADSCDGGNGTDVDAGNCETSVGFP